MAPRRHDRFDYARFEVRMVRVWHASEGAAADESRIEEQAQCTPADACRVAAMRRFAGPILVRLWLEGALTFRQAYRIATLDAPLVCPHTDDDQIALAAHHPAAARALKRLEIKPRKAPPEPA